MASVEACMVTAPMMPLSAAVPDMPGIVAMTGMAMVAVGAGQWCRTRALPYRLRFCPPHTEGGWGTGYPGGADINTYLMMMTFRVWVIELAVSAVNYFALMKKVYEPRYGKLRAHQIGMSARIVYIFGFAYFILFFAKRYTTPDTFYAGAFWLLLMLAFEWIGSFIQRRPVREILEGWHINKGFMWPYVLAAYLLSPLIVGLAFHPGQ